MKKQLTMLLAAALCASSITLGACGSPAPADNSAKTEATTTDEKKEEAVDPAEKFVGDWKLAYIEVNGVTMAGDLSQMFGDTEIPTLAIDKNGTGSMALNDDEGTLTWKLVDDNSISIVMDNSEEKKEIPVTYDEQKATLSLTMEDDSMSGTLFFTADGTSKDVVAIDISQAKDITSADEIAGEWKMSGAGMNGMFMYGDAETIASISGGDFDPALSITADGKITLNGSTLDITIDENGASVGVEGVSLISLKTYEDKLVMDISSVMGSPFFVLYSK